MNKIDLFPRQYSGEQLDEIMLKKISAIKDLSDVEGQLVIDQIFSEQRREKKLSGRYPKIQTTIPQMAIIG